MEGEIERAGWRDQFDIWVKERVDQVAVKYNDLRSN